ncbi:MAG: hypothetical protein ACI9CF_001898 [Candidatus Omnitrophota bacterium]|jgi:hypothetical protein
MTTDIATKTKLQFSIICDNATRGDDGKVYALGIFETIGGTRFPIQSSKFMVVNRWSGGKGHFDEQVRIIKTDTNETITQSRVTFIEMQGDKHFHTTVNQFTNTTFKDPGDYRVEVLLDSVVILAYPLMLHLIKPKPATT